MASIGISSFWHEKEIQAVKETYQDSIKQLHSTYRAQIEKQYNQSTEVIEMLKFHLYECGYDSIDPE